MNEGGARPDVSAADFLAGVEERFRHLRGRPLLLSPKDTRLALLWHEAGVPLEVAVEVIEDLFARARDARRRGPRSLAYCDEAVRSAATEREAMRAGARRGGGSSRVRDDAACRDAYESAARAVRAASAPPSARDAARKRLERLARGDREPGIADPLLDIEEDLVAACLVTLNGPERAAIAEEARREIGPWSESMSDDVRGRALRRAEARAVRVRFGLPDLSLLPLPPADPGSGET